MAIAAPSSQNIGLSDMMKEIASGRTALPEFQRGWTWDDARIRNILATLTQGYPMGAVMRLENGGEARFKTRAFEGAPELKAEPDYLVLDGQQRLTSIYRAAFAKDAVETKNEKDRPVRRFYYLDIRKCLDCGSDRSDAVVSVPEDRRGRGANAGLDLSSPEREHEAYMFPANVLFDAGAMMDWFDGCKEFHGYAQECLDLCRRFSREVLAPMASYSLPVITLPRDTPRAAVCTVFENVNTGGVQLSVFELVTASFAAEGFDLRQDWQEHVRPAVRGDEAMLATDLMQSVDEKAFLTAAALYASHAARAKNGSGAGSSCKKQDVLALPLAAYLQGRDAVVEGFRLARRFLISQGVFRRRDLPYDAQLIPLACICAHAGAPALDDPRIADLLAQWYWCGVMGEMYSGSQTSRYGMDMDDMSAAVDAMLKGGEPPAVRTASDAWFSASRLLSMQSRGSAAYKGVMGLLYRAGSLDFRKGGTMNPVVCMDESPDIHHVFPKAWCDAHGVPRERRDSVVNKTPLLPASNRSISGDAPSVYAGRIMDDARIDETELRRRIESNLVDWDAFIHDDFGAHFAARARRLLDLIEKAMGKAVADRASEQTVQLFGKSLA